ncbi:bifunctional UDP-N-acetylglucosamine diphosphorylase/glucosamine-1-phosphate N-acetyltransferase GlmU [Alphaproteobacteria bacterium]|nr:bifunctional UDP-N-acetylglucosamine diphosphorylase/glucosamine-1-phosphate N-acetyltransferase GlmU [Alphaproteobacteria bacterium]
MKQNIFSSIVLAAGSGSRMRSSTPKVLHKVGGETLIGHVLTTLKKAGAESICLVTSPDMGLVRNSLPSIDHAIQETPLGTAHAVLAAEKKISSYKNNILVLCGDAPLITEETIKSVLKKGQDHDVVILGMHTSSKNSYGRIITDEKGSVEKTIEVRDCGEEELKITLCNSGILLVRHDIALPLLKKINNANTKKEFYLTDLVKIARKEGFSVGVVEGDEEELQGINTQAELAEAEEAFQKRKKKELLENGVTFMDPKTVYLSHDTQISSNVLIEPHVFIGAGVILHSGVHIRAFSYLEGVVVHENSVIGPFARIRPETVVGEKCKIGNFVEIKKTTLGENTKVSHLTYLGDAILGSSVNVGAGTITCNYDGYLKHKTVIEDHVFVGSNTALVAPVTLEKGSMIGAGSVITKDVKQGEIALSRSSQKNIRDGSERFHSKNSKKK